MEIRDLIFKQNRHCIIIISGETGSGKSYVALKIASLIDPYFKADILHERLFYSSQDFLKFVSSDNVNKLYRGAAVISDEFGATASHRTWFDPMQIALIKVAQTVRHLGLLIILTVPDKSLIDNVPKKLHNIEIWTMQAFSDWGYNLCSVKRLERMWDTEYKKYYRLAPGLRLRQFFLSKADNDLVARYEGLARDFKLQLPLEEMEKARRKEDWFKRKQELREKRATPNRRCYECGNEWHSESNRKYLTCTNCHKSLKLDKAQI